MQPSDELIEKFRQIYIQEFGEEIIRQQAYEKFLKLTNLRRLNGQSQLSEFNSFP